jgi:hypothetical protein
VRYSRPLASTEVQTRHIISAGRSIYRLTSETIASDPNNVNGAVNYTYDAVGNRKQITSTLAAIPAGLFTFRSISTLPKKPGGVRKRFGSSPYPLPLLNRAKLKRRVAEEAPDFLRNHESADPNES